MTVTEQGRALRHGNVPALGSRPVVVALVLGSDERRRLGDAVRNRADVRFVERLDELLSTLRTEEQPILAVLVEPRDRDDRQVAGAVRSLRQRLPSLPIIGYCRIGHEHSASIRELAVAGVHELVFRGVDDTGVMLRSVLSSAAHATVADAMLSELLPLVPAPLHPFIRFCLTSPQHAHSVGGVAGALGINRKTLVNYCARADLPSPGRLLSWCRLLLAAHYLATTTRTVERIALQLDFASDTALRNMIKRYTGMRAQELRHRDGASVVLAHLTRALASHRDARSPDV
jgi:AraC-like DNA-binding protein